MCVCLCVCVRERERESVCVCVYIHVCMHDKLASICTDGTFQATAGFQGSVSFQKAIKMVLRCNLSVNSRLSGFKLEPGPTHAYVGKSTRTSSVNLSAG